jgi:hypothetical protein
MSRVVLAGRQPAVALSVPTAPESPCEPSQLELLSAQATEERPHIVDEDVR